MRFRLLPAMCVVSLVLLGCGYFGTVAVVSVSAARAGVSAPAQVPVIAIAADEGRVVFVTEQLPAGLGPVFSLKPGIHPLVRFRPFRPPDLRRLVGQFEYHRINPFTGSRALIVGCPIWCIAVPLFIPTVLLLWRRRRHRAQPAGFSVLTDSNTSARSQSSHTIAPPSAIA